MSELAELYAIFLVLYLFECCAWVPRRSIGIVRILGRWRARRAWRPSANVKSSVCFGAPWPPLGSALLTDPLPVVLGPDGIAGAREDGVDGAWFTPWADLGPVRADGTLVEGVGPVPLRFASRRGAASLAHALESLRCLTPKKRATAIERYLDARYEVATVGQHLHEALRELRGLRISANLLWLGLFGGLGAVVATGGVWLLVPVALLVLIFWVIHAFMLRRTWRRLTCLPAEFAPESNKRWVALLSPLAGVRAADLVMRELVGDLEPVAVAAALVAPDGLRAFSRPWLATLIMQRVNPAPGAQADSEWWRKQSVLRTEKVLRDAGLDPQVLLAPPARDCEQMRSWCPHCLAQFERSAGEPCPGDACPAIVLQGFSPGADTRET